MWQGRGRVPWGITYGGGTGMDQDDPRLGDGGSVEVDSCLEVDQAD